VSAACVAAPQQHVPTGTARPKSPQVRLAIRRLMRVTGPMDGARARRDWVTLADLRTSGDDARIALRAAMRDWP